MGSVIVQFSRGFLIFLIFLFIILELVIFIANIPPEFIIPLWYAVLAVIVMIVITWIVYRHSKNKEIEEEEAELARRPKYTPKGEDPRIGRTYEWRDEDPKR